MDVLEYKAVIEKIRNLILVKASPQPLNVECWHKTGEIFARKMDSREPCDLIGKERGNFFGSLFQFTD